MFKMSFSKAKLKRFNEIGGNNIISSELLCTDTVKVFIQCVFEINKNKKNIQTLAYIVVSYTYKVR